MSRRLCHPLGTPSTHVIIISQGTHVFVVKYYQICRQFNAALLLLLVSCSLPPDTLIVLKRWISWSLFYFSFFVLRLFLLCSERTADPKGESLKREMELSVWWHHIPPINCNKLLNRLWGVVPRRTFPEFWFTGIMNKRRDETRTCYRSDESETVELQMQGDLY